MSFDRADYSQYTARQRAAQLATRTPDLRLLAQSAVHASALMSDPAWAVYQQMLQAAVDTTVGHRRRLAESLTSPECSTLEQMTRIKHLVAECDGLINAWMTAINLPKVLQQNAEKAQEILNEQTGKFDESAA